MSKEWVGDCFPDDPEDDGAATPGNGDGQDEHADPRPPLFTDESLALRFAERHAGELRHVAKWSRWLIWDGSRWQFEDTLRAFDFARKVCREASAECNKPKIAAAVASAKTVAAIERLAKCDRRHAATADQWDADPLLLNTPAGAIDLRSGKVRPHRLQDHMTKITAAKPDHDCPVTTWLQFLNRVTGGNAELIAFLQRMAGYSLTGLTREHAMFFLHGTGANGKSVFIKTISGILGDYHRTAPVETFTASQMDKHPTDLAGLHGARLVTSVETEEGRRWAESKIKALTGGDTISARFMRQDFFEFTPQFKLLIAGNHKPGLRSVDEAIRRRLNLVPFDVTIPQAERDKTLTEKLEAEWPGILAWMIDGCLQWQEVGLAPPKIVTEATDTYLASQDAISEWVTERCERDSDAWTSRAAAFESWAEWAAKAGEYVGNRQRFNDALEARGFEPRKRNTAPRPPPQAAGLQHLVEWPMTPGKFLNEINESDESDVRLLMGVTRARA
jgi:putative DNA primase/helicase